MMAELSLHRIKKIDMYQEFCAEGRPDEFSVIKIDVETKDSQVKEFRVTLFIDNETDVNMRNLILAGSHGRVKPKPAPEMPEDPLEGE